MTDTLTTDAAKLRMAMADKLQDSGALRTEPWRKAVLEVPREEFIAPGVFRWNPDTDDWSAILRAETPRQTWLQMAYSDTTWITQLEGTTEPIDVDPGARVTGDQTSSATLPALVVRMWEDLDVADGMRVGEVATGTGYSTALGCARLGSELVTSIEVDPAVAARSAAALARSGYTPQLMVGDGLAGFDEGRNFDRIIATCSVHRIPDPWLAQIAPGGIILATLSSTFGGSGLVKLNVTGPQEAHGQFLDGTVSFMTARAQDLGVPGRFQIPEPTGTARPAEFDPDAVDDWTGRFVAGLVVPGAQWMWFRSEDGSARSLMVRRSDSWALVDPTADGGHSVDQGGPVRLWDGIESAWKSWQDAGSPPHSEFHLLVEGGEQFVTHPRIAQCWPLA